MSSSRERLRMAGQADLGAWIEASTGRKLWSVQQRIASAASQPRARVAVPSCTASGKTFLAARIALAFMDSFSPGVPCVSCGGPCEGAKIITLASKFEHLRDVLWGEIRTAYADLVAKGIVIPGRMGIGQTLRLDNGADHFMIGQSPHTAEGLQGYHGAHILVIGDEATALPEEVTQGLVSTLATGDARLLLIANPTTPDTWFAQQSRSARTNTITISAWDTPLFTGEDVPPGSYLLTPDFLEELKAAGMGPGTYDWTTKVEGKFWDLSDDVLIADMWYEEALSREPIFGTRAVGIDLAPYGSNENVIAVRDGNALVAMRAYPAMRPDLFFAGPVTDMLRHWEPHYVIYDADGVGSGAIGYAEDAVRAAQKKGSDHLMQLMPFRGALSVSTKFLNARSAWWWNLRRRFENGAISIPTHDLKLREQATKLKYSITPAGDIRVETKEELRKRDSGFTLDRADALMYCFAMTDELPIPANSAPQPLVDYFQLKDRSVARMIARDKEAVANRGNALDDWDW